MKLLVAHSGGPSATLNASLVGIVDACRDEGETFEAWGARRGVDGLLAGDWAELSAIAPASLESLMRSPGSAIGSSRRGLTPEAAAEAAGALSRSGVDALVLAGGNGSMATAANLEKAARERKSGLRVIGLPNTVDNDVTCTDHTPGFGSAARFCTLAVRDIAEDNRALPSPITVVETIGRNTGWIAAAAALGRGDEDAGPHLIYLPEHRPAQEQVIEDARAAVDKRGRAVIVVCEGLRDASGNPFGADLDRTGDPHGELARNLGHALACTIQAATGIRARSERPGLLGRSCSWALSEVDVEESYRSGRAAAEAALGGASGVMIAMRRHPGLVYRGYPHSVPFSETPAKERKLPAEWLGEPGAGGTEDYLEWVRPLAGDIPRVERVL